MNTSEGHSKDATDPDEVHNDLPLDEDAEGVDGDVWLDAEIGESEQHDSLAAAVLKTPEPSPEFRTPMMERVSRRFATDIRRDVPRSEGRRLTSSARRSKTSLTRLKRSVLYEICFFHHDLRSHSRREEKLALSKDASTLICQGVGSVPMKDVLAIAFVVLLALLLIIMQFQCVC